MTKLDWFFLALLGIGFFRGWAKGAIKQLVSLAALILGIYLAVAFDHPLSLWLSLHVHLDHSTSIVIAFVSLFVTSALLLLFLGKIVGAFVKMIALGWLDRLGGALLGLLKTALIIGLVLQLYSMLPFATSHDATSPTHSFLYRTLAAFPSKVVPFVDFHFSENQQKIH